MAPLGQCYVHRVLEVHMKAHLDFEAACGDFGMRHLPVDITPGTVFDEMGVRKARGTPSPQGRSRSLDTLSRAGADARIAIYGRRVAGAEAGLAAPAAA